MGVYNAKARYLEEDYIEFEKIMLEMLPEGAYISEIAEKLGIAPTMAHKIKDKLIADGKITKKAIELAVSRREKREENEKKAKLEPLIIVGLKEGKSYATIGGVVRSFRFKSRTINRRVYRTRERRSKTRKKRS